MVCFHGCGRGSASSCALAGTEKRKSGQKKKNRYGGIGGMEKESENGVEEREGWRKRMVRVIGKITDRQKIAQGHMLGVVLG